MKIRTLIPLVAAMLMATACSKTEEVVYVSLDGTRWHAQFDNEKGYDSPSYAFFCDSDLWFDDGSNGGMSYELLADYTHYATYYQEFDRFVTDYRIAADGSGTITRHNPADGSVVTMPCTYDAAAGTLVVEHQIESLKRMGCDRLEFKKVEF